MNKPWNLGLNESPTISVIIPVYKVEDYLGRCVSSVLNNTYRNLEVICINDGSPDECLSILKDFSEKDDRVVIIDQENQGVQEARNAGLRIASGDYIAFIDSDDYIHPEYFASMMRCMQAKEADIVICGCKKFTDELPEDSHVTKAHYRRLDAEGFFKSYYARHMVWARLYRKSALESLCFHSEVKLGDDTLFNLEAVGRLKSPAIYETDSSMYYYFIRDTSIVHSTKGMKLYDIVRWYMGENSIAEDSENEWNWLLLMHVIKIALSCRYGAMFDKALRKKIHEDLRILTGKMNHNPYISLKNKVIHNTMFAFPELYRQFRLHGDPSLKEWEKGAKASSHEQL